MKKLLFVHDHSFKELNGVYLSSGGLPWWTWNRYLGVFQHVTIFGRESKASASEVSSWTRSSAEGVSFSLVRNGYSFFGGDRALVSKAVADADAVVLRLPSVLGLVVYKEVCRQGKPYCVEVVGCAFRSLWNRSLVGKVLALPMYFITRVVVSRSRYAIYVTSEYLQKTYPCKKGGVSTSCSNVELVEVREDVLDRRLKRIRENSKIDPIVIGMMGKVDGGLKGVDIAIKALAEIRNMNVELQIVGSGDAERWDRLVRQKGLKGRVIFKGRFQSGDMVNNWLDNLDVYIQPSRQEGLPRSLIEAMSRGCPAYGSRLAGIPELIEEDCLVAVGDFRLLAKKIQGVIESREEMERLAIRNHEESKKYLLENIQNKRELVLNKIIPENV